MGAADGLMVLRQLRLCYRSDADGLDASISATHGTFHLVDRLPKMAGVGQEMRSKIDLHTEPRGSPILAVHGARKEQVLEIRCQMPTADALCSRGRRRDFDLGASWSPHVSPLLQPKPAGCGSEGHQRSRFFAEEDCVGRGEKVLGAGRWMSAGAGPFEQAVAVHACCVRVEVRLSLPLSLCLPAVFECACMHACMCVCVYVWPGHIRCGIHQVAVDEIRGLDSLASRVLLASRRVGQPPHCRAFGAPYAPHGGAVEDGNGFGDLAQSQLVLDDEPPARGGRGVGPSSLGASSTSLHSYNSDSSWSNQMSESPSSIFHSALGHSVCGDSVMDGASTIYRPGEIGERGGAKRVHGNLLHMRT